MTKEAPRLEHDLYDQVLFRKAMAEWCPDAEHKVLNVLKGGYSGANVLLVDVAGVNSQGGPLSDGTYVLKLDHVKEREGSAEDEATRHEKAIQWNQEFAASHIPKLICHFRQGDSIALLYDIAGQSLRRLSQYNSLPYRPLADRLRAVAQSILSAFTETGNVSWNEPVSDIVANWLSYRSDPIQAPRLHNLVDQICQGRRTFVKSLHILANPIELCLKYLQGVTQPIAFSGLLHGDLHGGNILWAKDGGPDDFWLIDFAITRNGPILFDHAYLECFLTIDNLADCDPARLLSLLQSLDSSPGTLGTEMIVSNDLGLRGLIEAFRNGIDSWQKEHQDRRQDPFHAQWLLARICSGLNWANKEMEGNKCLLAFYYAAYAARQYLEQFHPDDWMDWAKDVESSSSQIRSGINGNYDTAWQALWQCLGGFRRDAAYILISGPLNDRPVLASLGLLPWCAVLDFDPNSDSDGLLKNAKQNMERLRSVHVFGKQLQEANLENSTAWMLCAGFNSIHEPSPTNLREWRAQYRKPIQGLLTNIKSAISPRTCRILVLLERPTSLELISRSVEEIHDVLGTDSSVYVCCNGDLHNQIASLEAARVFALQPIDFSSNVSSVFGTTANNAGAFIPSVAGQVELDVQTLMRFDEDIDVLHSRILETSEKADEDAFWRGAPPTYFDIDARSPIPRKIDTKLTDIILDRLKENQASVLEFPHTPGAGGTTCALVAAWAIREKYPTAIVKRRSKHTFDRIAWLFGLAGLPVLLVVDAVLSAGEVADLVSRCAKENIRLVVLRVVRVSDRGNMQFGLFDPMQSEEVRDFCAAYSRRVTHASRIAALTRLAEGKESNSELLRSPFFIGLTAFEEQFTHISDYVRHNIAEINFVAQPFVRCLALLSAFSQASMSLPLALRFGQADSKNDDLIALTGPAAVRLLVVFDDRVKVVHPLIARELMIQMIGGSEKWKHALAALCVDFVEKLIAASGGYSWEARDLLRSLFIEREDWGTEESASRRELFSSVIQLIPSEAGKARLFEALTEACPDEAHFWNHRGRHHAYADAPNYPLAVEFLERAIQLSDGKDAIHLHSLGMARRLWAHSIVRALYQKEQTVTPSQILTAVSPQIDGALEAFDRCRKAKADIAHGYITAIQSILFVCEELVKTSGGDYNSVSGGTDAVGEWLRSHLVEVEGLIYQLGRLRGPNPPDSYETSCVSKLARLYGNFEIIGKWEGLIDQVDDPLHLRRVIAGLYLAKRKRCWHLMEPKELRRVVKLVEDNLRSDATDERDIRMWFQAYRRLPEFNYYEAIERLDTWAKTGGAVDAYYYLYIVHYLHLRSSGDDAEEAIQNAIRMCDDKKMGPRGYSFEWLAKDPHWCPMISAAELGSFDKQLNFFRDTSLLALAEGTIEQIKPQRGYIRLGRVLRAFFVPPPDIRESAHINHRVHFHLGFSFEGFRAWNVRLGELPASESTVLSAQIIKPKSLTKLWVGGILHETSEEDIRGLFESVGDVAQLTIPLAPNGRNKGFALVTMKYRDDADRAIQQLSGRTLGRGRRLEVRFYIKR